MKVKELNAVESSATIIPNDSQESIGGEAKAETAESLIADAKSEVEVIQLLRFGKCHKINLKALQKALDDSYTDAVRMEKIATSKGLGRIAKSMSGSGIAIPTPSVINDLYAMGELGMKGDKKTAVRRDNLKALNSFVDALVSFGLTRRA